MLQTPITWATPLDPLAVQQPRPLGHCTPAACPQNHSLSPPPQSAAGTPPPQGHGYRPHGLIDGHEGTRQHTHSCSGTGRCAGVLLCSSPGGKGDQRLPHSCNGLQTVLKKVSNVVQGHWYQGSRCKGARKVQVVCGALAVSVDAGRTSKCTSISATPGSE